MARIFNVDFKAMVILGMIVNISKSSASTQPLGNIIKSNRLQGHRED